MRHISRIRWYSTEILPHRHHPPWPRCRGPDPCPRSVIFSPTLSPGSLAFYSAALHCSSLFVSLTWPCTHCSRAQEAFPTHHLSLSVTTTPRLNLTPLHSSLIPSALVLDIYHFVILYLLMWLGVCYTCLPVYSEFLKA